MGDRIAILNAGILQQVGSPLEVYERPDNVFVAQFIGTPPMNFLHCQVTDGGAQLSSKTFQLPAPAAARAALATRAGKMVIVGVRPEHLREATRAANGATAALELTVDLVETLGDEVVVHARAGDDLLAFKMDPHHSPEMGGTVQALVEIDRLHIFDADTEKRIVS
jgi:multiple sugar transport system ATP-binding protein